MKLSFTEILLDFFFDVVDIISAKKKFLQIFLTFSFFSLGLGVVSAFLVPEVQKEDLVSLREKEMQKIEELKEQEKLHSAALAKKKEEFLKKKLKEEAKIKKANYYEQMNDELYEEILNSVFTENKPELCKEMLEYEFQNFCLNTYYTVSAKEDDNSKLCDNIKDKEIKKMCDLANTVKKESSRRRSVSKNEENSISDENKVSFAEYCETGNTTFQKNVCWDNFYYNVATSETDQFKCNKIINSLIQDKCYERTKSDFDKKLKEEALTKVDLNKCLEMVKEENKKDCFNTFNENFLNLSKDCNEICLTKRIKEYAEKQENPKLCAKITTNQEDLDECYEKVYTNLAVENIDSRYCKNIIDEKRKSSCQNKINKEKDKNPEVKAKVYVEKNREVPNFGEELKNPLEESNDFMNSINYETEDYDELDPEIQNIIKQQQKFHQALMNTEDSIGTVVNEGVVQESDLNEDVSNDPKFNSVLDTVIKTDTKTKFVDEEKICAVYNDFEQKRACLDSLILKEALSEENLVLCAQIKDQKIKDYCEISIVEESAKAEADSAKNKCYDLSSKSAQNLCLEKLGFNVEAKDCLDYSDPVLRLKCIRENK